MLLRSSLCLSTSQNVEVQQFLNTFLAQLAGRKTVTIKQCLDTIIFNSADNIAQKNNISESKFICTNIRNRFTQLNSSWRWHLTDYRNLDRYSDHKEYTFEEFLINAQK